MAEQAVILPLEPKRKEREARKEAGKEVKEDINVDDVLSQAEKPKEKRTATTNITSNPELADQIYNLILEIKQKKAELAQLEDVATSEVNVYRMQALKTGEYRQSYYLNGTNGKRVLIVWKHAYSNIPLEYEQPIRNIVNAQFDAFFYKKVEIKVKSEISEDDLKELIKLVTPEKFAKFFEVQRSLYPTESYTRLRYQVFKDDENEQLNQLVKQHKPSFKIS